LSLLQWLSLVSICLLGAMSPGPSLAVMMKCTLARRGSPAENARAGYSAALAHGVATGLYGLLTVSGLALVITQAPSLYRAIQVLGAMYLLYLGIGSFRSSATGNPHEEGPAAENPALQGFLVAFLNPKLAVFMLALFSAFLQPHFGITEKLLMATTVGVTDAAWYVFIVSLISRQAFMGWLERYANTINRVLGVVLILLALSILATALFF